MTAEEIERAGSMVHDSSFGKHPEDDRFLAENAELIAEGAAEDAAAKVKREKAEGIAYHQKMLELRTVIGSTKMKAHLGAERYKREFGEDRDDDPRGIMAGIGKS
jgi:hypothetical protein